VLSMVTRRLVHAVPHPRAFRTESALVGPLRGSGAGRASSAGRPLPEWLRNRLVSAWSPSESRGRPGRAPPPRSHRTPLPECLVLGTGGNATKSASVAIWEVRDGAVSSIPGRDVRRRAGGRQLQHRELRRAVRSRQPRGAQDPADGGDHRRWHERVQLHDHRPRLQAVGSRAREPGIRASDRTASTTSTPRRSGRRPDHSLMWIAP